MIFNRLPSFLLFFILTANVFIYDNANCCLCGKLILKIKSYEDSINWTLCKSICYSKIFIWFLEKLEWYLVIYAFFSDKHIDYPEKKWSFIWKRWRLSKIIKCSQNCSSYFEQWFKIWLRFGQYWSENLSLW